MRHDAPRGASSALEAFVSLLRTWNRTINLIGARDAPEIWDRHIRDSLQCAPLIASGTARGIDLGSGAGFPGIVLALATGIHFDLIESDHRKAAFLREAARLTRAPVEVHACRIEDCHIEPAPLIMARGLAPLPRLLQLAEPLLQDGGCCIFLKGTGVAAELTAAERKWHMRVDAFPSCTAPGSVILRISELSRVKNPA